MYRGIAYAYKYEFTKEYRDGKRITVKRVRPVSERLLLPEGTIPPIIDDETARLALAAAAINTQEASRHNPNPEDALLRSGYIWCGQCGCSMAMHKKTKKGVVYLHYRCVSIGRVAKKPNHDHIEISIPKIDKIIWDYICGVIQEYRDFVKWCQEFKSNGQESATYKRKRDALRFLGVKVYIYKDRSPQGRYVIRLAPPELMRSLKLLPKNIEGTLSRSG
jgi:hypothetical protein